MRTIEVYLISELDPKTQGKTLDKYRYYFEHHGYWIDSVIECINELLKEKEIDLEWYIQNDKLCWKADRDYIVAHYDLSVIEHIQREFEYILEDEHEYVISDEYLIDIFDCNDYHFNSNGLMI